MDPSFDRSVKSFDRTDGFKKKLTENEYGHIGPNGIYSD